MNSENSATGLTIGFIGAGRVGCTLGRYFFANKLKISGYYSKTCEHACQAAKFTHSKCCKTIEEVVKDSQIIFITTPDANIYDVFLQLKNYDLRNKILCHCSGALSAQVFSGIEKTGAYGYSIHPIFAISDKENSYKELYKAFFTVEGSAEKMWVIESIFQKLKNPFQVIQADQKHKYHASLVMASNLVIGLYHMSSQLLEECGFSDDLAQDALTPLFLNNAINLSKMGCKDALTGPIDRNDFYTVQEHLKALENENNFSATGVYKALSEELIQIAKEKYSNRDYRKLEILLNNSHSESINKERK